MKRLLNDPKTYIRASVLLNGFMAIAKLITGILTFSVFMVLNAFYNAGMGLAKSSVLSQLSRRYSKKSELEVMHRTGIILISTSLIYVIYAVCMLYTGKSDEYPTIVAVGIIIVVFAEIIINLIGLVSTRRSKHMVLHANKCISLASSLINLVMVQTALMSLPDWGFRVMFNNLSGIFFGTCAGAIGAYMLFFERLPVMKKFKITIKRVRTSLRKFRKKRKEKELASEKN